MESHRKRLDLIIFDMDGTLVEKFKLRLLPGVAAFFRLALRGNCPTPPRLAIATNQGGVGLRYWMELEGWGKPKGYPTANDIEDRLRGLVEILAEGDSAVASEIRWYSAFAYQDRKGRWGPVPSEYRQDGRWQQDWRKPGAGMLLRAIEDAGTQPDRTLMVGDSDDDRDAAGAAGCRFEWAQDFFNHSWGTCEDLETILRVQ